VASIAIEGERAFSERRRSGSKCEGLAEPIFRQNKYSLDFFGFVFLLRKKGRKKISCWKTNVCNKGEMNWNENSRFLTKSEI
jgi:hypothetical protein